MLLGPRESCHLFTSGPSCSLQYFHDLLLINMFSLYSISNTTSHCAGRVIWLQRLSKKNRHRTGPILRRIALSKMTSLCVLHVETFSYSYYRHVPGSSGLDVDDFIYVLFGVLKKVLYGFCKCCLVCLVTSGHMQMDKLPSLLQQNVILNERCI